MKKGIAFILAVLMVSVIFTGCVSKENGQTEEDTTNRNPSTTTTSPAETEKPSEPEEKKTAAETIAAYLRKLLKENPDKELPEILRMLDMLPCFDDLETEMDVSPYPQGYAPYIYGFEYGTEFPEYVQYGMIYNVLGVPFGATVFELKEGTDKESFIAFLKEKSSLDIGAEKPATQCEIGLEEKYAFIIFCNEELKTDFTQDREESIVGMMKKLRLAADLSMGVTKMDVTSERALYFFGIEKNTGLLEKDGAVCEPMVGGGFSLVMVKVKDEKDAQKVADEMKSGLNPGKWICMRAETVRVEISGKYVMGIMAKSAECDRIATTFHDLLKAA